MGEPIIRGPRVSGKGLQIILPAGTRPTRKDCPRCSGRGSVDGKSACPVCHGRGIVETRELERKVKSRCTVPTGENTVCGFPFFEGESQGAIEQHARECLAENHDHVVAWRKRQHPDIMKPWDPEFAAWTKVNRDALIEGRMRA